jgi:ABC transport system ATP-binding/permease protein
MALISLQNIQIAFGGPKVLDGVDLQIEPGERICLVGRNGAGKSTLLKIINGSLIPDEGDLVRQRDLKVAQLEQEVPMDRSGSVFDVVAEGWDHEHELNHPVERVISLLNLDPQTEFSTCSGGTKRRVLLARALVNEPDILILDEPTNHLDIEAIEWLENYLRRRDGALLFVTHDRAFVRNLSTRIVEIDRGRLYSWEMDYDTFMDRRDERLNVEREQWKQFDKKLTEEEMWIRQGIPARRTRNIGRVRSLLGMREERGSRRNQARGARFSIQEAELTGHQVITAHNASYSWDGEPAVAELNLRIMRCDRIGIIGPNGCGKSTLLRLLLGDLEPQNGTVKHGTNLKVAYFDQHRRQIDETRSVKWNLCGDNQYVMLGEHKLHVLGYLRNFLFSREDADQPAGSLSGGERNRLLLAKLFARSANVLVLDEPTNDLDADTMEVLEEQLTEFDGTILLVSHDREFLNNVVGRILSFEGGGHVGEYAGGYDDWMSQSGGLKKTSEVGDQKPEPQKTRTRKLTNKERCEVQDLPKKIEQLEAELETLTAVLNNPGFYRSDPEDIRKTTERAEALPRELDAAYARWAALEEHS